MRTTAGKNRAQKQSKLMYIIWAPMRTLAKARNFYMKGLEDCAGKVSYGGVSGYTASQVPVYLPKSFSVNSSGSSNGEDFKQRLRTVPPKRNSNVEKRNDNNENKAAGSGSVHRIRPVVRKPIVRQPSVKGVGMRRSYSVGLKMGTIDEEMACSFEEDEVNVKANLYPRSRSYAVKKRRY